MISTRILETPYEFLRASVVKVEVDLVGDSFIELKTTAVMGSKKEISSADSAMLTNRHLAQVGEEVVGKIRIDIINDAAFRVRYSESSVIPDHQTPMVIGTPAPATKCKIKTEDGKVKIKTATFKMTIDLASFRIVVRNYAGVQICGIGGPEKDNFTNWDSVNTGICRKVSDSTTVAVENFDLPHDAAVYGLGERFIQLNKVGQTIDLNMIDALGVTTPRAYKNIPFFVTTAGYGVYFNHSSLMTYWVGSMSSADIQVAAEDDFLDYYVFLGEIKDIVSLYTDLTGKGSLPPQWTFGYWQSKISYQSAEETLDIARKMRENDVPCDVIHLDTFWFKEDWYCDLLFDKTRFPDPTAYLKELADLGVKVSLWQLPYIPEGSKLFDDLKAVDGFVKREDGSIYNTGICFTPGFKGVVGVVDYTNPAAIKVHQEAFRQLFRQGAKVIKTDFGEAAPLDGVYHDGTPGHQMHNLFPLLYNKALFEVTKEETGDGVVWARSAWAGSQRYPLHWGGDNSPNYWNMAPQLQGGLSFGMSGFQFWSQDIGGFCGTIDERLLIRWMQLGMFLSHSRIHGFGDREIYKFAPDTLRVCRNYIHLRYQLLPYIFGSAKACVNNSLPLARPLVVDYQDDPTTFNMGDEYLFGDSLLVAPLMSENDERKVYLPAGTWTDWWTKERITGGKWMTVNADLEIIPLYIREGGIIPMGPVMPYVDAFPVEKLQLLVSLFENDGETIFEIPVNGNWVPVKYSASNGKHELTIGATNVEIEVTTFGDGNLAINR
jgi:alpha-D-xyloside xylohydrolase